MLSVCFQSRFDLYGKPLSVALISYPKQPAFPIQEAWYIIYSA